ncbi:unnamed protein product [Pelagomonas calceolata]|uniref:Uncharacterized protein n=1 Tax=Pelagomonas calceolata TaxID=35677 RepID=A0A8J2X4J3_9STRA|nr:unnamed protein product [Pelagomonas calceolata]
MDRNNGGRAWYERENVRTPRRRHSHDYARDDSDVESILSISASSSSRGYTLPPRDSSVHESPLAEVPELHLLELEEQVTHYENLTRQMAAEKGATLPDFPEDDLPLDRAARLQARFARVANLHESLEATLVPALPPPPRDAIVAARRAAAPLLLAAALNRATRSAPKRRGFHALLAAALAKRSRALPAPPPDTTAVDAAVEAARAEDRAALAAVEEKLEALRTVPVQRLFERRALRTRRSLFAAWREAAAEEKRAADGLRRGITIMRRNVSRWRRAALRRALDVWAERANARYVYVMLTAVQTLDEGVHCYRRRVVAGAFGAWARAAARATTPATVDDCGPPTLETTAAPAAPRRGLVATLIIPCALAFVAGLLFL